MVSHAAPAGNGAGTGVLTVIVTRTVRGKVVSRTAQEHLTPAAAYQAFSATRRAFVQEHPRHQLREQRNGQSHSAEWKSEDGTVRVEFHSAPAAPAADRDAARAEVCN